MKVDRLVGVLINVVIGNRELLEVFNFGIEL